MLDFAGGREFSVKIDHLILGEYQTNSYILRLGSTDKDVVIVDTGLEGGPLVTFLVQNELNPVAVIFTHGHADHIRGFEELRFKYPTIKSYIHKNDAAMFTDSSLNLSYYAGVDFKTDLPEIIIESEKMIELAGMSFAVLHTPGHTPGSICLYCAAEGVVFTGDTLFAGGVGRTDFPGYDSRKMYNQLIEGIKSKLMVLPETTAVYPGHGSRTTIGREKRLNPFLTDGEA